MEDVQFRRLMDSVSPTSPLTRKLCERLGYNSSDLQYKRLEEFKAATLEMQQMKYDHYKARMMRILGELLKVRSRYRATQNGLNGQIGTKLTIPSSHHTQLKIQTRTEISDVSSSVIEREISPHQTSREKIVKKLILDELSLKKRNADMIQSYNQRVVSQELRSQKHANKKSQTSRLQTEQSKQQSTKADEDQYEKRLNYLNQEEELSSRVSMIRSELLRSRFKQFSGNNEKVMQRRLQQEEQFKEFQRKTLSDLQQKEEKVREKVRLFRNGTVQQLNCKSKSNLAILQKKEQLNEEQENAYIAKQVKKLENIMKNQDRLRDEENKKRQTRLNLSQTSRQLWADRMRQLTEQQSEKSCQLLVEIQKKNDRVLDLKRKMLSSKSQIISEMHQLKLEDVQFNRSHNDRLRFLQEERVFEKTELIEEKRKQQRTSYEENRKRELFQYLQSQQSEASLWRTVREATLLFDDPTEYERYKQDLRAVMLRQKPQLEPRYQHICQTIRDLLTLEQADSILLPEGLADEVAAELKRLQKPK